MTTATIKLNKFNVTNGTEKARVWYHASERQGAKAVVIYAKDYGHALGRVFSEAGADYRNDTDTMTDYFDKGQVVLKEGHPLYAKALERATA